VIAAFAIALEARAPDLGLARAYRLRVGQDLFGVWVVELQHGRIGTAGRLRQMAFDSPDGARAEIRRRLKRRASAPRRIGVGYRVVGLDGGTWLDEGAGT
jgi:hypothetical protein